MNVLMGMCFLFVCVCVADLSFVSVPPSLLACACLCDAIQHLATEKHLRCVEILSQMTSVEQVYTTYLY